MTTLAVQRQRRSRKRDTWDLRALDGVGAAELGAVLRGRPVPSVRMSESEFFEWAFDHINAEWVDGEVVLMAPANDGHESLDEWLGRLMGDFVEDRNLGIIRRNMFVRLAQQRRLRVPDLMFISNGRRRRIGATRIEGAPDLIVEIVSPDSQSRDRRDKYAEYQAAGVREYWIIDPMSQTFEASMLRGKRFRPVPRDEDLVPSQAIRGFYLREKWLFAKQRPKVAQLLKELGANH